MKAARLSATAPTVYGLPDRPPVLLSFIGGLGGRRFRPEEFNLMLTLLEAGPERPEERSRPYLLFTERECREMQRFIAVARAGGESHEA